MLYNALIRTHHITSRKKVAALKQAASAHDCFALLRSGGIPGIMYVESNEKNAVEAWVSVVRNLRYKDFQLVARPGLLEKDLQNRNENGKQQGAKKSNGQQEQGGSDPVAGLEEVETVKEFGSIMEDRGVWRWWRKGMGYHIFCTALASDVAWIEAIYLFSYSLGCPKSDRNAGA